VQYLKKSVAFCAVFEEKCCISCKNVAFCATLEQVMLYGEAEKCSAIMADVHDNMTGIAS